MIEDQDARLGLQPFGEHDLLLVAAGEVEAERVDVGRLDAEPSDPVAGKIAAPSPVSIRPMRVEALEIGQSDVRRDRQEQHQPLDAPLAREVADAAGHRRGGRREAHRLAADLERPALVRRKAGERARQLLAARTDDAGDAEDLAGMQREAHVLIGPGEAQVPRLRARHRRAGRLLQGLAVIFGLQPPPDHQPMQHRTRPLPRPGDRQPPRRPS